MAVDQTWTDPSTSGAIDLATDDILTETVWDKVLSDLKRLGGTAGPPNTQATRGAFPVSGYMMGAIGHDRHVESGTQTTNSVLDTVITTHDYAFGDQFASAPRVTIGGYTTASTDALKCQAAGAGLVIKSVPTITGVSVLFKNGSGETVNVSTSMIAEGSDV